MTFNDFEIEFFEIVHNLKSPFTEDNISIIKKTLLKLNNPTYYRKFAVAHPATEYGYYSNSVINPILKCISSMITILKSDADLAVKQKEMQKEYSWAFNEYPWYVNLEKVNA